MAYLGEVCAPAALLPAQHTEGLDFQAIRVRELLELRLNRRGRQRVQPPRAHARCGDVIELSSAQLGTLNVVYVGEQLDLDRDLRLSRAQCSSRRLRGG